MEKHFEAIARIIKNTPPVHGPGAEAMKRDLTHEFANQFSAMDPDFDRRQFLDLASGRTVAADNARQSAHYAANDRTIPAGPDDEGYPA